MFRQGAASPFLLVAMLGLASLVIAGTVAVTQAQRKSPVQYAKRVVGRKTYGGQSTTMPLRVNYSGVMPIIFALNPQPGKRGKRNGHQGETVVALGLLGWMAFAAAAVLPPTARGQRPEAWRAKAEQGGATAREKLERLEARAREASQTDESFGFEAGNPVRTVNVDLEYRYMARLAEEDGKPGHVVIHGRDNRRKPPPVVSGPASEPFLTYLTGVWY